jgi:hypothetical protein
MTIETAWRAETTDEAIRPEDAAAIRACLLDYFDGWFDGDVSRMQRALHPGLAKHSLGQDRARSETLEYTLLAQTGDGWRITGALWRWADGNGPRAT